MSLPIQNAKLGHPTKKCLCEKCPNPALEIINYSYQENDAEKKAIVLGKYCSYACYEHKKRSAWMHNIPRYKSGSPR